MWALIRKNLWMWKPGLSGNLLAFGLALVMSLCDAKWAFPAEVWALVLVFAAILGQAAAVSSLSIDVKEDNVLFLEYLPVRWSWVWLANWVDGMLTMAVFVLLLTWHRTLFWTNGALIGREYESFLEVALLGSRFQLAAIVGALMVGMFSYALFWRTCFRNELAAAVPMLLASVPFLMGPMVLLGVLRVQPFPKDLVPVALLGGALFSAGSLICFAWLPHHWSRMRRFVLVGLPLSVVFLAMELGGLLGACTWWRNMEWGEPGLRLSMVVRRTATTRPAVVFVAQSQRSGEHALYWDGTSAEPRYLGRGLSLQTDPGRRVESGDRLVMRSRLAENGLWPVPGRSDLVLVSPKDGKRLAVGAAGELVDEEGRLYEAADVVECGRNLLVFAFETRDAIWAWRTRGTQIGSRTAPRQCAFVLDGRQQVQRRIRLADVGQYLVGEGGRAMLLLPDAKTDTPQEGGDEGRAHQPPRYAIYDVGSDRLTEVKLPGRVMSFSRDLKRAICLRRSRHDGMEYRSVVVVHMEEGREQTLISEQSMGAVAQATTEPASEDEGVWLPGWAESRYPSDASMLLFDAGYRQAVWRARRIEHGRRRSSLVYIDMETGAQRVLVGEAQLPATDVMSEGGESWRDAQFLKVWGFTRDGSAFLYQLGTTMHVVNVTDGAQQTVELPKDQTGEVRFSPGGRRWLVSYYATGPAADEYRPPTMITNVCEVGKTWAVHAGGGYMEVEWLDDDHVIVSDYRKTEVWVVRADGTERRQIVPPGK